MRSARDRVQTKISSGALAVIARSRSATPCGLTCMWYYSTTRHPRNTRHQELSGTLEEQDPPALFTPVPVGETVQLDALLDGRIQSV